MIFQVWLAHIEFIAVTIGETDQNLETMKNIN